VWLPPFLRWLVCECVALGLLIWSTKRGLLASTATCRSPSSNLSAVTPRPPGLTKMYRPPWNLKPSLLVWSTKNGLLASTATCRSLLSSSFAATYLLGPPGMYNVVPCCLPPLVAALPPRSLKRCQTPWPDCLTLPLASYRLYSWSPPRSPWSLKLLVLMCEMPMDVFVLRMSGLVCPGASLPFALFKVLLCSVARCFLVPGHPLASSFCSISFVEISYFIYLRKLKLGI
jgi:hypothetical protein